MPPSRVSRVEKLDAALLLIRGLWMRDGIRNFIEKSLDTTEIDHYRVLRAIQTVHEPLSVGELADHLDIDASTSSRLVDRLVLRGYVERTRDPDDKRRLILRLLPAGLAAWETLRDTRVASLGIITKDWTVAEIALLADLIERLDAGANSVRVTKTDVKRWKRA